MGEEAERIARAGNYVSGRMNEVERERAEHDLAYDPAFRDAVLRLALSSGRIAGPAREARWSSVASDLSALPQMQSALQAHASAPPSGSSREMNRSAISPTRLRLQLALLATVAFVAGLVAGRLSSALF